MKKENLGLEETQTSYPTIGVSTPICVYLDNITFWNSSNPIGFKPDKKGQTFPIHPDLFKVINQKDLKLKEKDGRIRFNKNRNTVSFSGRNYLSLLQRKNPTEDNGYYPEDCEHIIREHKTCSFYKNQINGILGLFDKQKEALTHLSPHGAVIMKNYPQVIEFCTDYPAPDDIEKHVKNLRRNLSRLYNYPAKDTSAPKLMGKDFVFYGEWNLPILKIRGMGRNKTEKVLLKCYYKNGLMRLELRFEKPKIEYNSDISVEKQLIHLGDIARNELERLIKHTKYELPRISRKALLKKIEEYRPKGRLWDSNTILEIIKMTMSYGILDPSKLDKGFIKSQLFKDLTDPTIGFYNKEKVGSIYHGVSRKNVFPLKPNWQTIDVDLSKRKGRQNSTFSKSKLLKRDFEIVDFVMAEASKVLSSKIKEVERCLNYHYDSDENDELIQLLKSKSA